MGANRGVLRVWVLPAGLVWLLAGSGYCQTAESVFASAVQALRKGDSQTAYTLAERLADSNPRDVRAWLVLGTALSALKRNGESLEAFRRALALQPDSRAGLEGAAQAAYALHDPETQKLLERLLATDPHNETAYAMLGALAFREGNCTRAADYYRSAPKLLSRNVEALGQYGTCLAQTHRDDSAVPIFERMLALQPDRWENRYNLALIRFRTKQYKQTIEILRGIADDQPEKGDVLNLLAAAYEADHDTDQAVATLYRAIAARPGDVRNYLDLATLCMDHSAAQTGIDVVNAALKKLPDATELFLERAVLYEQVGQYEAAQRDFDEVDRRNPGQTLATLGRGIALLQSSKPAESLSVIRAKLQTLPNDATLHYLLAEVLSRSDAVPGRPEFQEAVASAERAAALQPDLVAAHDLLAGLLLKSGEALRSIEESHRALALDPADRTAVYHLLTAWRQRGNAAEVAAASRQLRGLIEQARLDQVERSQFRIVESPPAR